jgi:hypothetical protein
VGCCRADRRADRGPGAITAAICARCVYKLLRLACTATHIYAAPLHVGSEQARLEPPPGVVGTDKTGAMQDPASGLPRIPIPRTRVNSVAGLVIHRGPVECAAGGVVRAVLGAYPHARATVVNRSGGGPNPRPSLRRNTSTRKVEEQRARCAGKGCLIQSPHGRWVPPSALRVAENRPSLRSDGS